MIEWMKEILGDSYTEDIDSKIAAKLAADYAPKADLDAANQAKADAEAALEQAKSTDNTEALQAEIEKYKAEAEQAKADAEAQVAAVKFDALVDGAIQTAKGRNGKAIKALLDMDALKGSEDPAAAVSEALKTLQAENDYLFAPESTAAAAPATAVGAGSGTVLQQPKPMDGVEAAFYGMNPALKH